jgi:RNA recognition motif-containing protein
MNIYVGNLTSATSVEDLNAAFSQFGNVENVKIIKDFDTGESRGFGFVDMSQADGEKAIDSLHGSELKGNIITVNEARPRQPRNNFRGERRGGYDRGSRY